MSYTVKPNQTYDFFFFASSVLGYASLKGVNVLGTVCYDIAKRSSDVATIHASIKPNLPAAITSDHTELNYVIGTMPTGVEVVFALEWLSRAPAQTTTSNYTIVLGQVTQTQLTLIKDAITKIGVTDMTVRKN